MKYILKTLQEEYKEKDFSLLRIVTYDNVGFTTIFLTNDTIFEYNQYNDNVVLRDCYINNELVSVKFKGENIKSLAVIERK